MNYRDEYAERAARNVVRACSGQSVSITTRIIAEAYAPKIDKMAAKIETVEGMLQRSDNRLNNELIRMAEDRRRFEAEIARLTEERDRLRDEIKDLLFWKAMSEE